MDKDNKGGQKRKDVQLEQMSSLMGACICVYESEHLRGCVCVLTAGENSFACPFTLLPFTAQCSSSHWTKRPHCGIQMKEGVEVGGTHRKDRGAAGGVQGFSLEGREG